MNLSTEFHADADAEIPASPFFHIPGETSKSLEAVQVAVLAGTIQQLIDDLPEQISLLDDKCNILVANHAWKETIELHGHLGASPGCNYRDFCEKSAALGYEPAVEAMAALDEISSGRRSFWQLKYNGRERWSGRDFQICFHRIEIKSRTLILVSRFDVTEILELRRLRDDFSNSLIAGQAVERQRLGRELHDSTSQSLAAIGLLLGRLKDQSPRQEALDLIEELQGLVSEAQQEIRAISYLAHPPSLEKLGLTEALRCLVSGVARRAGLEASFEIQGDYAPMSAETERAIYRLAQEALSNVYRHSRAKRVRLMLLFRDTATHFVVADDGIGLSPDTLSGNAYVGVGLAGMRLRFSEIGGRLTVHRLSPGTAIAASVLRRLDCDSARLASSRIV